MLLSTAAAGTASSTTPSRRPVTCRQKDSPGDRLGQLALTKAGLAQRDRFVFDTCVRHGLPLSVAMAGGYAPEVEDIVDIHAETVRLAARAAAAAMPSVRGAGQRSCW